MHERPLTKDALARAANRPPRGGAAEWEASRRELERRIDPMEKPVVQDMAREGAEGGPVSG